MKLPYPVKVGASVIGRQVMARKDLNQATGAPNSATFRSWPLRPSSGLHLFLKIASSCGMVALAATSPLQAQHHYLQTNLVSDVAGWAAVTDPNLVNAWGLSRSATSPWWISDNGTGLSTLYNGAGAKQALVVTVPPPMGVTGPSAPTGTVFNGTGDFQVVVNQPARFIFVTEEGTVSGWNPGANPTVAINKYSAPGKAVYKGLAIGQVGTTNYLYAANFLSGKIDVFDKDYNLVDLGTWAFKDPHLPKATRHSMCRRSVTKSTSPTRSRTRKG